MENNNKLKPVYEYFGLENPTLERMRRENDKRNKAIDEADRKGRFTISWGSEYLICWMSLITMCGMKTIFPPYLMIDRESKPWKDHHDGSISLMGASMDMSWLSIDHMCYTMPMQAQITVYENAVLKELKTIWHNEIPIVSLRIYMRRLLLHEIMHYLTTLSTWMSVYENWEEDAPDEIARKYYNLAERVEKFYGTFGDEVENEAKTLNILEHLCYKEHFEDAEFLVPLLCGPYEMLMRAKHPYWNEVGSMLEYHRTVQVLLYNKEQMTEKDIVGVMARRDKLVDLHRQIARKNGVKFALID